jgi:MauM/NapG family ferredoxin protein
MKLSLFRRITQAVTFSIFIALFLFTAYPYSAKIPVDAFLRLDPLVATVAMIGSRAFIATMIWAAVLLVLSLVIGRFFCGYICPLGTLIDLADFLIHGKKHKKETVEPKPNRRIKYYVLIGVIAASLLGANFLAFLSPMSIAPRVFSLVLFPPIVWLINGTVDLFRPVLLALGLDTFTQVNFARYFFSSGVATFFLFAGIVALSFWRKRFWCRYICPTGAFISLFSRFGLVKRQVNDAACIDCKLCAAKCDFKAVSLNPRNTVLSECVLCGDCVGACKKNAVSIGFGGFGFGKADPALNIERRGFIQSSAAGLLLAATAKAGLNSPKNLNGRFIRPPGSLPESEFLARCIRCGECMKTCKTNGLQPAGFEAGFDGLWTPHLVPRHGPCEDKCNMCGHVCPTQAIRALPLEEKQFVKMGTAVIDRHRCIAWEQEKLCLICAEICPIHAIDSMVVDNFKGPFKRPFVMDDKCIGCGYCEMACPVYGRAAIEVYSIGEDRIKKGSYITEKKKALRAIKESAAENNISAETMGSGGEVSHNGTKSPLPQQTAPSNQNTIPGSGEELPKGFTE